MFTASKRVSRWWRCSWCSSCPSWAQLIPRSAHTNLYFPHIANGGVPPVRWQMRLVFDNPHGTGTVTLSFWGDNGSPLAVDFGSSPSIVHTFTGCGGLEQLPDSHDRPGDVTDLRRMALRCGGRS